MLHSLCPLSIPYINVSNPNPFYFQSLSALRPFGRRDSPYTTPNRTCTLSSYIRSIHPAYIPELVSPLISRARSQTKSTLSGGVKAIVSVVSSHSRTCPPSTHSSHSSIRLFVYNIERTSRSNKQSTNFSTDMDAMSGRALARLVEC